MTPGQPPNLRFVWATRGRNWGFRFLLDGGFSDPLKAYEAAFSDLSEAVEVWARRGGRVALRFPDPEGRRDGAGRVIPHEFLLLSDLARTVDSVPRGIQQVWPLVSQIYARIWLNERAPDRTFSASELRAQQR